MLWLPPVLLSSLNPPIISGSDVSLRLVRSGGEILEELSAKDKRGRNHLLLVSPSKPGLAIVPLEKPITALQTGSSNLYSAAPTLGFTNFSVSKEKDGARVVLTRHSTEGDFQKSIFVPSVGHQIDIELEGDLPSKRTPITSLLLSYAFLPDGNLMSKGGKPDSTFLPGIRPQDNEVVGDHVFRSPVAMAQKGTLAAMMLPDLDVLRDNRPMGTILDLDCKNGVVDAPLLSYGFAAYKVKPHVYYETDFAKPQRISSPVRLSMTLLLDADAEPHAAYEEATRFSWQRYGQRFYNAVFPQALPFEEYAKFCYPAAFAEQIGFNKLGWFEQDIDGHPCGGVYAGWGYDQGTVSWQCWFNNLRSAYGMRSWGKRLGNNDWIDKADKMLNLALAAPLKNGACPTTYNAREKRWIGSLMQPNNPVGTPYYDLTNMAWKGIWLLRWANDFPNCPRKFEILAQCRAMADCIVRYQNSDGSIPTWLTEDEKVVRVLDHSAQTALPAWFLFELAKENDAPNDRILKSAIVAADFLDKNVVDGQYYYDFETFFSCSSKACAQINGTVDHEAMRDPHTLQPPQNTLSMQWTAEAMRDAYHATKNPHYLDQALKALEKMNLYQIVWPISYCHTAYVYGGFGVQNSDGEYNDARQAQFGETLCSFGAELGRQDLFERGVAAVRASLALITHPLHDKYGIYPHPNCPSGLEPENCCHDGYDDQAGRTGFDWGEGSGLTSMAVLLDKYGDAYVDNTNHWKVGINGVVPLGDHFARRLVWDIESKTNVGPKIAVVDSTGTRKVQDSDLYPSFRVETKLESGNPELVLSLFGASAADLKADLIEDQDTSTPLVGTATDDELHVPLSADELNKPFMITGTFRGVHVKAGPYTFYVDPHFDFSPTNTKDWVVDGNFADPFTHPTRLDFGLPATDYMIGTCEDGAGSYDDSFTGTITSPEFVITKPSIHLMVSGGSGQGVHVELVDSETGQRLAIARGANSEVFAPVVWDVSKWIGRKLRIRAVDQETGGWGHINVADIRSQ